MGFISAAVAKESKSNSSKLSGKTQEAVEGLWELSTAAVDRNISVCFCKPTQIFFIKKFDPGLQKINKRQKRGLCSGGDYGSPEWTEITGKKLEL